MSGNKYLIPDRSSLLYSRIAKTMENLQTSYKNGNFQTKEAVIFEAIKAVGTFYQRIKSPSFSVPDVSPGELPDPDQFNEWMQNILDDLSIMFKEFENLETITVSNFNFVVTEASRLQSKLKAVASKLGDYILYAVDASSDLGYKHESFNNLNQIDNQSQLLNSAQLFINQEEGIVSLPLSSTQNQRLKIIDPPVLNSSSNGTPGNNQESGKEWNGSLVSLIDNNADTWFEYENVVSRSSDEATPLILDLTISLGSEQVINHIMINPNNFGTKTALRIRTIETSVDGQIFTSIKEETPISGFESIDQGDDFVLSSSTSKFSGQGFYTFLPRLAKYVHLVIEQSEPYLIETSSGQALRYAIGVRDIDIFAYSYQPQGELISKPYSFGDEIRKVTLFSSQVPNTYSQLADVRYYVSPDNGNTWHEIAPTNISDGKAREVATEDSRSGIVLERIPEVLTFNTSTPDAIITSQPVQSILLKTKISRHDKLFEEKTQTISKQIVTVSEPHIFPTSDPYTLQLFNTPLKDSVTLIDPLFGSRGLEQFSHVLGYIDFSRPGSVFDLPFTDLKTPMKKNGRTLERQSANEWIFVEVDGVRWSHSDTPLSTKGSTDKVFILHPGEGKLTFGDGINGMQPENGSRVTLRFSPERIFPLGKTHASTLEFPTSAEKNSIQIYYKQPKKKFVEVLPQGTVVVKLAQENITNYDGLSSVLTTQAGKNPPKDFVNGRDELIDQNDWSIDVSRGVLYLRSPLPQNNNFSVEYTYQPLKQLSNDDWTWEQESSLRDSIKILDSGWYTEKAKEVYTPQADSFSFGLSHMSILKETLKMEVTSSGTPVDDGDNPLLNEVVFIDGVTELRTQATQTTQRLQLNAGSLNTILFDERVIQDSSFGVSFTNTNIFNTEVVGVPSADGEYQIDRVNNIVLVQIGATTSTIDPGYMSYFFVDSSAPKVGLFSVDYENGHVYCQRAFNGSWSVEEEYEYTNYEVSYRIARLIPQEDFSVDLTGKSIILSDTEVSKHSQIPQRRNDGSPSQYIVNYDYIAEVREDISGLQKFFSPLVKDFIVKVLTKGKIF